MHTGIFRQEKERKRDPEKCTFCSRASLLYFHYQWTITLFLPLLFRSFPASWTSLFSSGIIYSIKRNVFTHSRERLDATPSCVVSQAKKSRKGKWEKDEKGLPRKKKEEDPKNDGRREQEEKNCRIHFLMGKKRKRVTGENPSQSLLIKFVHTMPQILYVSPFVPKEGKGRRRSKKVEMTDWEGVNFWFRKEVGDEETWKKGHNLLPEMLGEEREEQGMRIVPLCTLHVMYWLLKHVKKTMAGKKDGQGMIVVLQCFRQTLTGSEFSFFR